MIQQKNFIGRSASSTRSTLCRALPSASRAVIETLEERALLSTYMVNNTADNGAGSLRQAIIDANSHVNGYSPSIRDVILFDSSVFGGSTQTISLLSALPTLTDSVEMDGSLGGGTPGVQLDGSSAGAGADGLEIYGGDTLVKGLIISNFGGNGIVIAQQGGDVIQGNYIGTDATGTGFGGNSQDGIVILSGGNAQILGNVISANGANGIDIHDGSGDLIKGNYIGVDSTGSGWMGNGGNGILLSNASTVQIGGSMAGDGNIIAANAGDGIQIANDSSSVLIQGNFIGTDTAGDAGLGNGGNGVNILGTSHDITLGGMISAGGNIISGNSAAGVQIAGAGANLVIEGNRIGTAPNGLAALGNLGDGIYVSGPANASILYNVISGNDGNGVDIAAGGVATVQGNLIGLAADGATPLGNLGTGVFISGSGNVVGGTGNGQGNVIAFNSENGVAVLLNGVANSIRGNSIFSNTRIGIDLGNDGATPNDSLGHIGPNNYADFPVIAKVVINNDGTATITGTLIAQGAGSYMLDFYGNAALAASGYGQGQTYLGAGLVTALAAGSTSFTVNLTVNIPAGQMFVTGTATDGAGNTSEFSQGVKATFAPPVQQVAVTTTGLSSSSNPSLFGQAVTLTAAVTGGTNATGTVDFIETLSDGSTLLLGTAMLDSHGVATFTTSAMAIGSHTIQAAYHGDANNAPSTSTKLNQVVKTTKVTINGHTYNDTSGNGLSADDALLAGVTLKLYQDTNANGKIDSGDRLMGTMVSGNDGSYQFSNLVAGRYLVQEITPSGYVRTAPALTDTYVVNASAGAIYSNEDFDNYKKCSCNCGVSNISYMVVDPVTGTHTYCDLRGHTLEGDTVIVKFTVPANKSITLTLVSYTAPGGTFVASQAANQQVYQYSTGTFGPGVHTMTVVIPKCYYQVDFVCGYLIDHFGPAGSSVFYSAQDRLFSADNGGKDAQFAVALATNMSMLNT